MSKISNSQGRCILSFNTYKTTSRTSTPERATPAKSDAGKFDLDPPSLVIDSGRGAEGSYSEDASWTIGAPFSFTRIDFPGGKLQDVRALPWSADSGLSKCVPSAR